MFLDTIKIFIRNFIHKSSFSKADVASNKNPDTTPNIKHSIEDELNTKVVPI